MLRMFGIDPEDAKREIMAQDEGYKVQDVTKEERSNVGRGKWEEWVKTYK